MGNDVPLLLIYQQNLLLLLDWNICCTRQRGGSRGGKEAGNDPLPTLIQTSLENLTRDRSTDLFDLASGPVVFSQIKSFGHNDETTQQGAYLSLTQLQYKTVGKRQHKKCKKGFLCSRSTTHRRHCIPGFSIKALEVSFFVYLLLAVNNCVKKCLQQVLKSEMCIRYAARVLWPIFTFSLNVFTFFMCHFARLRMLVYEDAEDDGRPDPNWTGLIYQRAFREERREVWLVGSKMMTTYCILVHPKIMGVQLVFIFLLSVILGRWEHRRIKVILLFLLFILDHTTCLFLAWLFCTGNKHVEHIFDMICLGQNRAFFA